MPKPGTTHAVVIDAGMGGLIAARMLADHYGRVTILERDVLPPDPEPRRGVPHGRHAHGLLARGREALEEMFLGLTDELVQAGATLMQGPADAIVHTSGVYFASAQSGLRGVILSRPMLETQVCRRLLGHRHVSIHERVLVQNLIADGDRITGVELATPLRGESSTALAADLVVDASGRHSRSPDWLGRLGYARPAEETIGMRLSYATRLLRRRPEHLGGKRIARVSAQPPAWRGGIALAIEHGRWMVTQGGYFDDRPPADEAGFLDFARTLAAPDIADLLAVAEPLSPATNFAFPESRRRRYERLSRFPEGYLVFGDALCSFNPIYGQGMTTAAVEGLALGDCLTQGEAHLARRFFTKASTILDTPWQLAAGSDLQHPRLAHLQTPAARFMNWYIRKVHQAAAVDPSVGGAFMRVQNLIDPPRRLFGPVTMSKVLLGNLRRSGHALFNGSELSPGTMRQSA